MNQNKVEPLKRFSAWYWQAGEQAIIQNSSAPLLLFFTHAFSLSVYGWSDLYTYTLAINHVSVYTQSAFGCQMWRAWAFNEHAFLPSLWVGVCLNLTARIMAPCQDCSSIQSASQISTYCGSVEECWESRHCAGEDEERGKKRGEDCRAICCVRCLSRTRFLPLFVARESQHVRLEQIIDRCKIKRIGFRERIELQGDGFEHYSCSDPTERTTQHQSGSEQPTQTLLRVFPAGTRRLCNVRLTLDMTSDRHCILVENENRVDVNIWRQFDVDLTLDFGYTT